MIATTRPQTTTIIYSSHPIQVDSTQIDRSSYPIQVDNKQIDMFIISNTS
jgi:hypothetical protein